VVTLKKRDRVYGTPFCLLTPPPCDVRDFLRFAYSRHTYVFVTPRAAASANLTPCILELGGKDPFIVFDDVDYDHCLDVATRASFINCGQNCVAAERVFVQAGVVRSATPSDATSCCA
jgi:acyl-CoA reductase-like NAD-dependent aldehyde dehydrogenase